MVSYKQIDLTDFEPEDIVKRRTWLCNLKLQFAFGKFTYAHGNHMGNLTVIWKQPPVSERASSEDIRLLTEIKNVVPKFATRAMRREFMELYSKVTKDKPAILRSMYRYLTGHSFAAENRDEESVDNNVCEFLLGSDDPKLAVDLRKNNGKVRDPKYNVFWKELEIYLDEKSVVHERRQSQTTYMPFAVSVADLRNQSLERLPTDKVAPSMSWIRLNFMPGNPYSNSAMNYTANFNVKHSVQQRLLRAKHPDSGYAFTQFTYLKQYAVELRDHSIMQCLDDKAIIPIREPNRPTSACQRKHHGSLVAGENNLLTLDHDYHLCGIVPSVCLLVDIPEHFRDTFYHGDVHITLKEKVLQPSSPIRHATETTKITREVCSDDDVNCNKPVLLRYTDGGPDHRTTYQSVQMAAIEEFISLDLDMFIACRTAPNQSYNNPAERIMSLHNLGLQNVAVTSKHGTWS
ncbi:uncharacterized protein LOC123545597 [Mercenaria mercenaria]|uniref:uncharacterized protein LOC123545597 n=1 Tax=Mercenaria mercenaria TaxID=6596 RepID=UPI00234EB7A0|nr:uncharacterized protein LOC123545597 [Mercenaria mercenaria]